MSGDNVSDKATWWSITAFDKGEQDFLASGQYPEWVSKVYGGLETCPESQRVHYQGAIQCRSQQRFSAIKKMLPKAHIEPAKQADALKKYAMKAETAIGSKLELANKTPYYTLEMLLKLLAITHVPEEYKPELVDEKLDPWEKDFWCKVQLILISKPYLVGALMKPDVHRAWKHSRNVWVLHMTNLETNELMGEEAIVLQPPQVNDADLITLA